MQITIRLTNLDNILRGVRKFGAAIPGVGKAALRRAMQRAKKTASGNYPFGGFGGYSIPPRGTYRRTGRYGRGFQIIATQTGTRMESGAAYAVYVGGNSQGGGQVRWHAGRWPLIAESVEAELQPLITELETDFSGLIRQEGIGL